jgi:hypothetical protein
MKLRMKRIYAADVNNEVPQIVLYMERRMATDEE